MNNLGKRIFSVLLACLFILNIVPTTVLAEATTKTVKVGYLYLPGFQEEDKAGNRSGYGYEILQSLARYTNWKYEYVGYKDSWPELSEKLAKGDIDMIVFANKNSDREKIYDFSTDKIGDSSTVLLAKGDNTKYNIEDFSNFKDMKIGVLKNNSKNVTFDVFAKKNNITYKTSYYNNATELLKALNDGSVDAIVYGTMFRTTDYKVIAKMDSVPFYVAVKKGNVGLLKEVNDSIKKLEKDNPNFITEFANSNKVQVVKAKPITFTSEEQAYLDDLKKNNKKIKVLIKPNCAPLSYFDEEGKPAGIITTVAEEIQKRTGLKFEYVQTASWEEYYERAQADDIDVILDVTAQTSSAEKHNRKLTDPFLMLPAAEISLKNNEKREKVDVIKGNYVFLDYAHKNFKVENVFTISNGREATDDVLSGKVDSYIDNLYVLNELEDLDQTNKLIVKNIIGVQAPVCMAVNNTNNKALLTILNKTIKGFDKDYIQSVLVAGLQVKTLPFTLKGFLYNNPVIVIGAMGIIFLMLLFMILHIYNIKRLRMEHKQKQELEKFISYLCATYEEVEEIDLDTRIVTQYSLHDGEVVIDNRPIKSTEELLKDVHPDDVNNFTLNNVMANLERIMKTCTQNEAFLREKNAQGEYRWMSYFAQGVRSENHRICLILKKDVTEFKLKDLQRQQELKDALVVAESSSKVKDEFLSHVSHEVRTPLNAIINYLKLAKEEQNLGEVKNSVNNSLVAADHLLDLINDILDTTAISTGKLKLNNQEFSLKDTVITSCNIFSEMAKEKGVEILSIIDGVEEENVVGDKVRLQQILVNLLSNALKFTNTGGKVTLTVKQTMLKDDKVYMNFEVEDTGKGIAKEFMDKLFKPFEQEDSSISSIYGGTGLGLSIVSNIVNMQHGSINVESEEGKGSKFKVDLPFGYASKHDDATQKRYPDLKILVVDSYKSATCLVEMLKSLDAEANATFDVESALTELKSAAETGKAYDLCICADNINEELDCFTFAQKVRLFSNVKMVIINCMNYALIQERIKKYNISGLYPKPIFKSTILEILSTVFSDEEEQAVVEKTEGKIAEKQYDFTGKNILVVEDNDVNAKIVEILLEKVHANVDRAVDGHNACEIFGASAENHYSAILMDIMMPELDGYETTKIIRMSERMDAQTVPIIAYTANVLPEDVSKAMASGMNGHLGKPIDKNELYKILEKNMQ